MTSPPCSPPSCLLCRCYPLPALALIQHAGLPRILHVLFILFRLLEPHAGSPSPCMSSLLTLLDLWFPMQAPPLCCYPSHLVQAHHYAILLLGFYLPILSCPPRGCSDHLGSDTPCLFYPNLRDSLFIFLGSNNPCGATKAFLPSTIVFPHIMILGLNYSGGTGKGLYHYFWKIFLLSLEVCFSSSTL